MPAANLRTRGAKPREPRRAFFRCWLAIHYFCPGTPLFRRYSGARAMPMQRGRRNGTRDNPLGVPFMQSMTDLRRAVGRLQQYGRDAVAQIGTFGTMAARAAVRDVARSMGFPYLVGDKISKPSNLKRPSPIRPAYLPKTQPI